MPFSMFLTFSVLASAEGALRDLKYFSLTKNLRRIKKVPAPGNILIGGEK